MERLYKILLEENIDKSINAGSKGNFKDQEKYSKIALDVAEGTGNLSIVNSIVTILRNTGFKFDEATSSEGLVECLGKHQIYEINLEENSKMDYLNKILEMSASSKDYKKMTKDIYKPQLS